MGRQCADCGNYVVVGQGKWVPKSKDDPTLVMHHKSADLCQAEGLRKRGNPEALARLRATKAALKALDAIGDE